MICGHGICISGEEGVSNVRGVGRCGAGGRSK